MTHDPNAQHVRPPQQAWWTELLTLAAVAVIIGCMVVLVIWISARGPIFGIDKAQSTPTQQQWTAGVQSTAAGVVASGPRL